MASLSLPCVAGDDWLVDPFLRTEYGFKMPSRMVGVVLKVSAVRVGCFGLRISLPGHTDKE